LLPVQLGVHHAVAMSNGEIIEAPKFLAKVENQSPLQTLLIVAGFSNLARRSVKNTLCLMGI